MTVRIAIISTVAALTLAACGGSSKTTSTSGDHTSMPAAGSTSATTSPSTSTTAPARTTTTVTTVATVTTTAAGPPPCVATDLAVSFLGQQGATGHGLLGFALRNVSGHTCHTFGFPGVLFLDRAGRALPTRSSRTTRDFFGTAPKVRLLLSPGQSASFRVGVTHGITSTANCTTAYGLQVIPPDDTQTLRVTIPGGAYECRTATVSPLSPGHSAYP